MIREILSLLLIGAIAATSTMAIARSRHHGATPTETYSGNPNDNSDAGFSNLTTDPNAVYVGGTYAGSDPDPNIRAALSREFARHAN
jgi:hypothetical protein